MTEPSPLLEFVEDDGKAEPSWTAEVRIVSSRSHEHSKPTEVSCPADEALEVNSVRSLPLLFSTSSSSDSPRRRNLIGSRSLSPSKLRRHCQLSETMQQQEQDAPMHQKQKQKQNNPIVTEQPSPCTGRRHGTDLIYLQIMDDTCHDHNKSSKQDNDNSINNTNTNSINSNGNVDDPFCSTCQHEQGQSGSTVNNVSTIETSTEVSSSKSIAARWFALETTAEDRLSWHIITNELKELAWLLFHFIRARSWKKKLLTVAMIGISIAVFYDLFFRGEDNSILKQWIEDFITWMTWYPTAAEFVFALIYALFTQIFIPPTLLLLGAGWAFTIVWEGSMGYGIVAAAVPCFAGSVLGSLASFLRARYMMRDLIELFASRYPIVRATDQALQRDGLRILLLLRLCPLIPYNALNYLGGITKVSWKTFTLSLIGMLPYQILIIVMGASAGSLAYAKQLENAQDDDDPHEEFEDYENVETTEEQEMLLLLVTSMGIATLIIAMVLTFRYTKKELQKVGQSVMSVVCVCVV
jgi:uncharacterized membrane protein YdjX (TVP38/TMEM64 family)